MPDVTRHKDFTRYKDQFDSLITVLNAMETRYRLDGPISGEQLSIKDRLAFIRLIQDLKYFAYGQFRFFYNGFRERDGSWNAKNFPQLSPQISEQDTRVPYPPERVLTSTIDQIAADVATIQLVVEQRIWKLPIPISSNTSIDLFEAADSLARKALWLDGSAFSQGERQVFTYLTNSVQVRVLPYSHVVLLGIPYTCLQDLRSLMAIPHEVGHFRFWESASDVINLADLGSDWAALGKRSLNLREIFYPFGEGTSSAQSPVENWVEEIFADVYGTLVGGPLYIRTAMDRAIGHTAMGMVDFDSPDPHPTPLIRPLLMIKALKTLGSIRLSNAAKLPKRVSDSILNKTHDDVEAVTIQLFNEWKRMLEGSFLEEGVDRDPNAEVDFKYKFKDPIVEDRVRKTVAWNSRNLDPQFLAEGLVLKAILALVYASKNTVVPLYEWAWPNSKPANPSDTRYANLKNLYENGDNLLKEWIKTWTAESVASMDAKTEKRVMTELGDEKKPVNPDFLEEYLPIDWRQWVALDGGGDKSDTDTDLDSKGYFVKFPPPGVDILYAGKTEEVMDPRTRPFNTSWLPVYGAGGWTTGGTCTNNGHPWY